MGVPKELGKTWKKKLDTLCREVIMARDKTCQWPGCGKIEGRQWAHVRSRRYLSSRWDTRNSMALCAGHHLEWHHRPLRAVEWFQAVHPDRARAVLLYDHGAKGGKIDREAIRLGLEQELARHE